MNTNEMRNLNQGRSKDALLNLVEAVYYKAFLPRSGLIKFANNAIKISPHLRT